MGIKPTRRASRVASVAASICVFSSASVCFGEEVSRISDSHELAAIANSDLLVRGTVDAIDMKKSSISVLGQSILIPPKLLASHSELLGHFVSINGDIDEGGVYEGYSLTDHGAAIYVPGATQLYIKGVVSSVDPASGTAKLGSLSVSFSGALHSLSESDVSVGKRLSFVGLAYDGSPRFYADGGISADSYRELSQTSSGARSLSQTSSGAIGLSQTSSGAVGLSQTSSGAHALSQLSRGFASK